MRLCFFCDDALASPLGFKVLRFRDMQRLGPVPQAKPKQSFVDVPITDAGVDTAAFLEAAEQVVKIFGELV